MQNEIISIIAKISLPKDILPNPLASPGFPSSKHSLCNTMVFLIAVKDEYNISNLFRVFHRAKTFLLVLCGCKRNSSHRILQLFYFFCDPFNFNFLGFCIVSCNKPSFSKLPYGTLSYIIIIFPLFVICW